MSSDEADWAISQYDAFINNEVVINREEFKNFDFEVQPVDDFLGRFLHKKFDYTELWKVDRISTLNINDIDPKSLFV